MNFELLPHCPLPNIGTCVEERCNFWDPKEGCRGEGVAFGFDPSLDPFLTPNGDDPDN